MDSNAAGEGNNENNVAFNTYWKLTGTVASMAVYILAAADNVKQVFNYLYTSSFKPPLRCARLIREPRPERLPATRSSILFLTDVPLPCRLDDFVYLIGQVLLLLRILGVAHFCVANDGLEFGEHLFIAKRRRRRSRNSLRDGGFRGVIRRAAVFFTHRDLLLFVLLQR